MFNLKKLTFFILFTSIVVNTIIFYPKISYAQSILFEDNFEDGNSNDWTVTSGNSFLNVNSNRYGGMVTPAYTVADSVVGDTNWSNYTYEVDMTSIQGDDVNLLFRYTDSGHRYGFHISSGLIRLEKVDPSTIGHEDVVSAPITFNYNTTYHMLIRLENNNIKIYQDGNLILEYSDASPMLQGKIGIRVGTGGVAPSQVWFDNVVVTQLPDATATPTATASPTSTSTPTAEPTSTSSPTATATATATVSATPIIPLLPVPNLKQYSTPWKDEVYAFTNNTIHQLGCALTSASMILQFHGHNILPDALNTWLQNEPDGYIRNGLINWLAVTRYTKLHDTISSPTLEYKRLSATTENLDNELLADRPVILKEDGHFIVGTGKLVDTYSINDPGYSSRTTLFPYSNNFLAINSFLPTHSNLSYMMFVVEDGFTLQLFDSNDNLLPAQSYVEDPINSIDEPSNKSGNPVRILLFEKPSSDIYKIKVTGTGDYNLDAYQYNVLGQVSIKSYSGNLISNETYSYDVNFDVTPPDVPTLLSPANNSFVKASGLILDWSDVNDQSGPVSYYYKSSWSNGSYGPVTTGSISQINASGSGDRIYQWQVQACDSASISNCSDWSEPWTVTVDNTKPTLPLGLTFSKTDDSNLDCGADTNEYTIKTKWSASSDTNFSNYEYRSFNPTTGWIWNAGNIGNVLSRTGSFTGGEGIYGFAVRAVDKAGNYSDWTAENIENSCKITYDSTAPTISINTYITNDDTPRLTGDINDNSTSINIRIGVNNFTAINKGDGTWELPDNTVSPVLADGTYDVTATAIDSAGNIGADSTNSELTIDTVAPTAVYAHYLDGIEVTSPIVYTNDVNKLSFTGSYNDASPSSNLLKDSYVIFDAQTDHSFKFAQNGAKSYCNWRTEPNLVSLSGNSFLLTDQEPFSNCKYNLEDGEYYMTHQVYDNAIRKDIPSITQFRDVLGLHFVIDKIMPTGNWQYPLDNDAVSGIVKLDFSADDNSSGVASINYQYKINDGVTAFTTTSSNWDTNPLELNSYILRAIITDNAGNKKVFDQVVQVSAIISGVTSATPSTDSAIISWTTDKQTKSRVVYDTVPHGELGTAPNYGYAFSTETYNTSPKVTSHTVIITGLVDSTSFYYRVISEGSPISISNEHGFRTLSNAGAPSSNSTAATPIISPVLGLNTTPLRSNYNYNNDRENEEEVLGAKIEVTPEPTVTPKSTYKPEVKGTNTENKNIIWISLGGLLTLVCIGLLFGRSRRKK